MDMNKMLENLKRHIKNKSTNQLIKDLEEYDIHVINYTPGSLGSIVTLDNGENFDMLFDITDKENKQIQLNMKFAIKDNIKFPMQRIDVSYIKDSDTVKDIDKYNFFPIEWGFAS